MRHVRRGSVRANMHRVSPTVPSQVWRIQTSRTSVWGLLVNLYNPTRGNEKTTYRSELLLGGLKRQSFMIRRISRFRAVGSNELARRHISPRHKQTPSPLLIFAVSSQHLQNEGVAGGITLTRPISHHGFPRYPRGQASSTCPGDSRPE
jgi:hypothetical protein